MKVLIIGLGSIALKHIQALRVIAPNFEILALRSSRNVTGAEGIQNIYSISEIGSLPDFVIISNPTSMHYKTIASLLELKVPLFIEKPAFDSLDNTDELLRQIEDANIITYTACNLRFHPGILFMKNFLSHTTSLINEVNIYCGSYLPDWRPGRDFRTIYSANKEMGGGVHLDLIHELDYACWLLGMPKSNHKILRTTSTLNISAIDYANYNLIYEGFTANIILNYYRRDAKRKMEIVFEDQTINLDLLNNNVTDNTGNILFEKEYIPMDSYTQQMRYFIHCLQSNIGPMNSLNEATEILKLCIGDEKA